MRLLAIVSALSIAVFAGPLLAASFQTPQALLEAMYDDKVGSADPNSLTRYQDYFSDHLNGLFKADAAKTEPGDSLSLDFDPVIAGQDGEAEHLKIGKPDIKGDKAKVVVKFTNGVPVTLYYSLVRQPDGWKVDDIEDKGAQFPWKVSAIFTDAK
ncbi:hypothetical protein [Rhizobium sp. HT1-10]|uniref:hypothetical protein n=1 Tax=Rhizobium sp. HT1-10 TaxID=3111638 RepID=UPI003C25ECE7